MTQEFGIPAEWKGFEIHPEYPDDGPLPAPSGPRYAQSRSVVRQMAEEAGLPLADNRVRVNTHRALEAAEFAREHGKFDEFHHALFRASFAEERNIGDTAVLVELAGAVGLDGRELARAVGERRYAERLATVTDEAHAYGISGTPTFLIGRYAVVGAQHYDVLKYATEVALGRAEPPEYLRETEE